MSSKHNLRSTAKGSSGSNGPKKPGGPGPNNETLTDNPDKKKDLKRRHRDADVIEKNREVLRQTIARKEGESLEKFEKRIRDKEYKDRGPSTGSYADKRRKMYNLDPDYREKVLDSNRKHIVTESELDRKRD